MNEAILIGSVAFILVNFRANIIVAINDYAGAIKSWFNNKETK